MHENRSDDDEHHERKLRDRARRKRELRQAERELAVEHPETFLRTLFEGPDVPGRDPTEGDFSRGPERRARVVDGDLDVTHDREDLPQRAAVDDGDFEAVDEFRTLAPELNLSVEF